MLFSSFSELLALVFRNIRSHTLQYLFLHTSPYSSVFCFFVLFIFLIYDSLNIAFFQLLTLCTFGNPKKRMIFFLIALALKLFACDLELILLDFFVMIALFDCFVLFCIMPAKAIVAVVLENQCQEAWGTAMY